MGSEIRRIQGAFDRAYWPLDDLIQRAETYESARKPYSFADSNHETLRVLARRIDRLADECPIPPFLAARRQFQRVNEAYFAADEAQGDLVSTLEAHQHLLDELQRLRQNLIDNGIGILPIPWWQFWKRFL